MTNAFMLAALHSAVVGNSHNYVQNPYSQEYAEFKSKSFYKSYKAQYLVFCHHHPVSV